MTRTVEQAESECRAAWALRPDAEYGWCVHHEVELEELTEPIENRIQYILDHKAKTEQIVRLDNLRPVLTLSTILAQKAYKELSIASAQKAYSESSASAWKAYSESLASAQKAYNESSASAWKAYSESSASAHKQDVPSHTWNGTSIFAKE